MIPAFLRSRLRLVPAQATLLLDVVTSSRYAALERMYTEACHDLHWHTRLAEHLRAELPEVQAEHEALQIVAKGARPALPSASVPNVQDAVLPPRPSGEAALRRGFSTLAIQARTAWSETAQLRREIATLEQRVRHHRRAVDSLLSLFAGNVRCDAESHAPAPAPAPGSARGNLLQEGLSLRLRPNHIVGALIAFLSFSILTGLLIVNSAAVTGRPVTSLPTPPAVSSTAKVVR